MAVVGDVDRWAHNAEPAGEPAVIAVRDLRMRYGSVDVLKGIGFTARRGEVITLLGPNGAGKTTTIEIIFVPSLLLIPELTGKMDGMAIRVPIPDGSVTDIVAELQRATDAKEINACLREAAQRPPLQGILAVSDDELVSVDIIGNPHSAIVDAPSTKVLNGTMAKVLSWYDNEWGYVCRLAELAGRLSAS